MLCMQMLVLHSRCSSSCHKTHKANPSAVHRGILQDRERQCDRISPAHSETLAFLIREKQCADASHGKSWWKRSREAVRNGIQEERRKREWMHSHAKQKN